MKNIEIIAQQILKNTIIPSETLNAIQGIAKVYKVSIDADKYGVDIKYFNKPKAVRIEYINKKFVIHTTNSNLSLGEFRREALDAQELLGRISLVDDNLV